MAEQTNAPIQVPSSSSYLKFPDPENRPRLQDYEYFERLFMGDHFAAFNIRIDDEKYTKAYQQLRYVKVNFAGLISKVIADFLFSEPVTFSVPDGDQEFVDALVRENNLHVQAYESALGNSFRGDALFKLRVGKRNPQDPDDKSTVIIEDITPAIYFPKVNPFNVRENPQQKDLAWTFEKVVDGKKQKYLRIESHTPGKITNKVYRMEGEEVKEEVDIAIADPTLKPEETVEINRSLLVHVPNWKTGSRHFGISDYYDLDSIFYAINNRMTKTDNILDKHSDPILAVPPGILDEKGKVKREKLNMIELPEGWDGKGAKPEYIVWNANLESAFKEVEKLVEFMFMVSETSPDILGMGQGQSDSGRALKLKILRTIAKAARKKLYYDNALKEVIYTAQLLAQKYNVKVDGLSLKKAPVVPEIEWADGLPIDSSEQIETETAAIDAGITSKKDSMIRVYGYDEETAEKKMKEINDETAIAMPEMNMGNIANKLSDGGKNKDMMTKMAADPQMAKDKGKFPMKNQ